MAKIIKKIDVTIYCDYNGVPLWSEAMIFRRLHAVNEKLIHDSKEYVVRRVAIIGNLQIVNFN